VRPDSQHSGAPRASSPYSIPDSLAGSVPKPADVASDDAAATLIGLKGNSSATPAAKRPRSRAHSPQSLPGDMPGEGDTVSVGGSSAYTTTGLPTARVFGNTDTAALAGALDLARVQARGGASGQHLVGEARLLSEYLQDSRPQGPPSRHFARSALHSPMHNGGAGALQGGTKRTAQDAFDAGSNSTEHLAQLSNDGLSLAVEAAAAASSVSALLPQVLQQSVRGDVTGALHALGSSLQSVVSRQARMTAHMLHLQRAAMSVLQYARTAVTQTAAKAGSSPPASQAGDRAEQRPPSPPASTLSGRTLEQQGATTGWHINTTAAGFDHDGALNDMSPLPGPALAALPSVGTASVDGAIEAAAAAQAQAGAVHDSPNFKALFSAVDKVTSVGGSAGGR